MAEVELEWYREHVNIEPPLSEICTPKDVDHLALNTIIHDFLFSRYEMPFEDYICCMAPYSVDKRIRRLIYDIDRGAVEAPSLREVECLIVTFGEIDTVLKNDTSTSQTRSELSLDSFDVAAADLESLLRFRDYLKKL